MNILRKPPLKGKPSAYRAARYYLARGWCPIPLCPPDHAAVSQRHRETCTSPGKAPLGPWAVYQKRRPTEAELLRSWQFCPTANVGIVLGNVSGLVGIDLDGQAGEGLLEQLAGGDLPPTLEFSTPRGGRRLLYALPPGLTARGRSFNEDDGEFRILAEGNQTVAPPSIHANGGIYAWTRGPQTGPPVPPPGWLMAQLRADQAVAVSPTQPIPGPALPTDQRLRRARAYLAKIDASISGQNGSRQLYKAACKTVGRFGLSRDDALGLLREDFNPRCVPPWSERELVHAVERATRTHTEQLITDDEHEEHRP